jgi:hypothetical protein
LREGYSELPEPPDPEGLLSAGLEALDSEEAEDDDEAPLSDEPPEDFDSLDSLESLDSDEEEPPFLPA